MAIVKSEKLESLRDHLSNYPPDWEEIVGRFKSHPNFDPDRQFVLPDFARMFREIHLDVCLEWIGIERADLNISERFIEGCRTGSYVFRYTPSGRVVAKTENGISNHKAEYDRVLLVDELPVVFDVRLRVWLAPRKQKGLTRSGRVREREGRSTKEMLRPEVYEEKLYPIRELFGRDVGYVVVISKDIYDARERARAQPITDSVYQKFKESNGILVPFYTDRLTFLNHVSQVVRENRLSIKDQPAASRD